MSERKNEPNETKEKIFNIEEYGDHGWATATVRLTKWDYNIPRAKLTIIEGHHNSSEDIDNAIYSFGKYAQDTHKPKSIQIVCRPKDMLFLANAITEFCKE